MSIAPITIPRDKLAALIMAVDGGRFPSLVPVISALASEPDDKVQAVIDEMIGEEVVAWPIGKAKARAKQ